MRKIIFGLTMSLALLFNAAIFADHGTVLVDIVYDENIANGSRNVPLRLYAYYDRHNATLNYLRAYLENLRLDAVLNGIQIENIRADEPVMDKNGNYTLTITYDEVTGRANQKYTISDLYDPVDLARESVLRQVDLIKEESKLLGETVTNLKVGSLQTVAGGFKIEMTYDKGNETNLKYHIDEYYDPKKRSFDNIEDRLMVINFDKKINDASVQNLKIGPITEVKGGYTVDVTFDEVGGSANLKYNIDDFYDPKGKAWDMIHDQIIDISVFQKIGSHDINNFKAGEIIDDVKNGKYTALITYFDITSNQDTKRTLESFYDPKARAINSVNNQIRDIKNSMSVNGVPITNLRIGKMQIL